jgi:hypothetical protein
MAVIVTKHTTPDKRLVLALCDKDILGKKFEDSKRVLDLSSNFFKGAEMPKDGAMALIKKAYSLNAVGEESVDLAIECGAVEKTHVIFVKKIPHAQTVCMK